MKQKTKLYKWIAWMLIFALVLPFAPPKTAAAQSADSGTIAGTSVSYAVSGSALMISGSGEIPDYDWDEFDSRPWDKKDITKIIVEDGITKIGNRAFCSMAVEEIVLPDSLEEIGEFAFSGGSYQTVTIPAGVTRIGPVAFHGENLLSCEVDGKNTHFFSKDGVLYALSDNSTAEAPKYILLSYPSAKTDTEYQVLDNTTDIEMNAFEGAKNLKKVTMPDTIYYIAGAAFSDCTNLETVILGKTTGSLGDVAFRNCTSLKRIVIPGTVEHITSITKDDNGNPTNEAATFYGCTNLVICGYADSIAEKYAKEHSLTFEPAGSVGGIYYEMNGSTLTISGKGAIPEYNYGTLAPWNAYKETIRHVVIGEGITKIGKLAFYNLPNLTQVAFPSSLQEIGSRAFYNCNLLNIAIPANVKIIESGAFSSVYNSLISIAVAKENSFFMTDAEGALYRMENGKPVELLQYPNGKAQVASYTIPEGVKGIQESLTGAMISSLVLPNSLEWIGANAFSNARVVSIVFPDKDGIITLKTSAFINTTISKITIPGNVKAIPSSAFACSPALEEVVLEEGVDSISPNAFQNCTVLRKIEIPSSVSMIADNAFSSVNAAFTIYGYTGSYTEKYAKEKNYAFVSLGTATPAAPREDVAIDEKTFPDDGFRSYVKTFDLDGNGALSEEEIDKVTKIVHEPIGDSAEDFAKYGGAWKSVKGIEIFRRLNSVYLAMNNIATIDLSQNYSITGGEWRLSNQYLPTMDLKADLGDDYTVVTMNYDLPWTRANYSLTQKDRLILTLPTSSTLDKYEISMMDWMFVRDDGASNWYGTFKANSTALSANKYALRMDNNAIPKNIYFVVAVKGKYDPWEVLFDFVKEGSTYVQLVTSPYDFAWDDKEAEYTPISEKLPLSDDSITKNMRFCTTQEYTMDLSQIVGKENASKILSASNGNVWNQNTAINGVASFLPFEITGNGGITGRLKAEYRYDSGLPGYDMTVQLAFNHIVSVEDCQTVPSELQDSFKTVSALEEHLKENINESLTDTISDSYLFDASLKTIGENAEWQKITAENFPAKGVEIFLPYPAGKGEKDTYIIAHIFGADCNGFKKGDIERPTVKKDKDGIRFTVMGLSPIMMAVTENKGTTDPGTTDPGTTDPGTTDPGTTDPGTTTPGATPSVAPTSAPSYDPSYDPSSGGSSYVPSYPVTVPTNTPTVAPTAAPTKAPTKTPTKAPTKTPTKAPTSAPEPTKLPLPTPEKDDPAVEKKVEKTKDAPEAVINTGSGKLADSILTKEEKKAVEEGAKAKIWMKVEAVKPENVPKEDKKKIEKAMETLGADMAKTDVLYLDLSMFKQVGNAASSQIHDTGIKVSVTITIPKELLNTDKSMKRTYVIVRVHDGVMEIIDGIFDEKTGRFAFETDKFSTYSLIYKDEPAPTPAPTPTPKPTEAAIKLGTSQKDTAATRTLAIGKSEDINFYGLKGWKRNEWTTEWKSSDPGVVSIDKNGLITAKKAGTVTISLVLTNKATGATPAVDTITVTVPATAGTGIALGTSKDDVSTIRILNVGKSEDINFYGLKGWKRNEWTTEWSSSDTGIVSIDKNGLITAKKAGTVAVSLVLTNKATGATPAVDTITVVVPDKDEKGVVLGTSKKNTPTALTAKLGKAVDVNFYGVTGWKRDAYEYYWKSSDTKVFTVNEEGWVTPVATGKATLSLVLVRKADGKVISARPVEVTVTK